MLRQDWRRSRVVRRKVGKSKDRMVISRVKLKLKEKDDGGDGEIYLFIFSIG